MISELALKHKDWICIARSICKDSELAKDLVQEMYIRLIGNQKQVNESYVRKTIKSIYIDLKRKSKETAFETVPEYANEDLSILDLESENEFIIAKEVFSSLKYYKRVIIKLSFTEGLREFSRNSNIPISTIQNIRKEFKDKVLWQKQNTSTKDLETLSHQLRMQSESINARDAKSAGIF